MGEHRSRRRAGRGHAAVAQGGGGNAEEWASSKRPDDGCVGNAIKGLAQVRVGRVICEPDGQPVAEAALKHGVYRVCRRAGLPERSWHTLRHYAESLIMPS